MKRERERRWMRTEVDTPADCVVEGVRWKKGVWWMERMKTKMSAATRCDKAFLLGWLAGYYDEI